MARPSCLILLRQLTRLLASRADPERERPWPEFAEQDCFACHHALKPSRPVRPLGDAKAVPGLLPWNRWHYAMFLDAPGRHPAGENPLPFDEDRAGPASTLATSILGTGELEVLAKDIEQRPVGIGAEGPPLAVDRQLDRGESVHVVIRPQSVPTRLVG